MKELEIKVPETFEELPVVVHDQGIYYSLRKLEANYKKFTVWHDASEELPTPFETCVVMHGSDFVVAFYSDVDNVWISSNAFEKLQKQHNVIVWQYINIP